MMWLKAFFLAPLFALAAFFGFHSGVGLPHGTPYAVGPSVACTQEAMECPDGTWVGRSGPNCEFVCPVGAASTTSTTPHTPVPTKPQPVSGVHLVSLSPNSGAVGTQITIGGSGFTNDNIIHFGGGAVGNVISGNGKTLSFTVPSSIGPYCKPGTMCPMYMMEVTPRAYDVYVENESGTSNTMQFTVTGAGALQ